MRHHVFDMGKQRRDAMAPGRCAPLEAEYSYSAARAEQICFTKEMLQLAVESYRKSKPVFSGQHCMVPRSGNVQPSLAFRARSALRRACAA
jgi:hypothetical protein